MYLAFGAEGDSVVSLAIWFGGENFCDGLDFGFVERPDLKIFKAAVRCAYLAYSQELAIIGVVQGEGLVEYVGFGEIAAVVQKN